MCGITGKIGSAEPHSREIVCQMTRALVHRGPDGEGFWDDGLAFLGHRRLAIIDLQGGEQPMRVSSPGEHVMVFNGEIYNYKRLQKSLAQAGIQCRTNSDTEVLLWLCVTRGLEPALSQVCGMFSFAWWDRDGQRLVLARDRIGIKPLYYHFADDGSLTFSSSLDSLTTDPTIPRTINGEALEYLLTLGYTPAPQTMYEGIYELPPATCLVWENGKIRLSRYWELDYGRQFHGTEKKATEQLSALLDEVVRDHMVSDVPVGAFLSGGIDSSAVVARARKFANPSFQAFTVSFPDPKYDESHAAVNTARHLGVRHSVISMAQMPVDDVACQFVLQHVGQPFADSSALPMYLVSRSASEKATVVLSGDGGDELFAGYDEFAWAATIQKSKRIPAVVRKLFLAALDGVAPPRGLAKAVRQIRKGLRYSLQPSDDLLLHLKTIIDPEEIGLLSNLFGTKGPELRMLREFLRSGSSRDLNRDLCRLLVGVCLPGDMLRKVDSMSMAASIEVRVPLLDHRIVEFANSLPSSMKISGGTRKFILRRAVRKDLPAALFDRPKWGFSVPLHKTFTPRFFEFCSDMFSSSDSYVRHWFGDDYLQKLIETSQAGDSGPTDRWSIYTSSHLLWLLIQLETWCQQKRIGVGRMSMMAAL